MLVKFFFFFSFSQNKIPVYPLPNVHVISPTLHQQLHCYLGTYDILSEYAEKAGRSKHKLALALPLRINLSKFLA